MVRTIGLWIASSLLLLAMTTLVWARDPSGAQELLKTGKELEFKTSQFSEIAEKHCYWEAGAPKTHACMEQEVGKMNDKYGAGAFQFDPQLNVVRYTGLHFQQLLEQYPKTEAAAEADYSLLTKQLVGHPDIILPRVKEFLQRHPDGKWQATGLLLWARLNEDVWWIHRKWSWVLYNWAVSPEDMIVKAEPYRQEALRTFERITKDFKKFPESKPAKKEQALLKVYKTDEILYGIVNETQLGTLQTP